MWHSTELPTVITLNALYRPADLHLYSSVNDTRYLLLYLLFQDMSGVQNSVSEPSVPKVHFQAGQEAEQDESASVHPKQLEPDLLAQQTRPADAQLALCCLYANRQVDKRVFVLPVCQQASKHKW